MSCGSKQMCNTCGEEFDVHKVIGIEYAYGTPERYDGVSEWLYPCGHRIGRWTGNTLGDGDVEPRFGGR